MSETSTPPETKQRWRWLFWGFAALGIAAAIALIWLVAMLTHNPSRRPPAQVAAQAKEETFVVGTIDPIEGTGLVAIGIDGPNDGAGLGSIKSSYDDRRNVLFLDQTTGQTFRVLPDNKAQIIGANYFPATAGASDDGSAATGKTPPAAYYVIQFTRARDLGIDLMVGQFSGYRQAVVLKGMGGVDRMWMIDDHQLALIMRERQQLFYRVIDIPAQKVVSSRKIEID